MKERFARFVGWICFGTILCAGAFDGHRANALSSFGLDFGTWSVGTCSVSYSFHSTGNVNIRMGSRYFGSGGWAVGGNWAWLLDFDPKVGCLAAADGYVETENPLGEALADQGSFGFSYCEAGHLYRFGFSGLTNSTVWHGDQGPSPDCVAPEIALSSSRSSFSVGQTSVITFTLTQPSVDFNIADVSVSHGALSNWSGSGTTYTATFTPEASFTGTAQIVVNSNAFTNTTVRSLSNADGADANNRLSFALDLAPPATPTIVATGRADGRMSVQGATTGGASVVVTFPDGAQKTVTANAGGGYQVTSDGIQTSGSVRVVATKPSGSTANATAAYVDAVAPVAPTVAVVTNPDHTVTVTGQSEPGSTVVVTFPGGGTVSTTAGADGTYAAVSATPPAAGNVTVHATDAANNASASTQKQIPAAAPSITSATQHGDGTVTVVGTAPAGTAVIVTYPDGTPTRVTADPSGSYTARSPTSQPSGTLRVQTEGSHDTTSQGFTDNVAPAAPIVTHVSRSPTGEVRVSGTAEPGATIAEALPGGVAVSVQAAGDGRFSTTSAPGIPAGSVSLTASDAAGNTSAPTVKPIPDQIAPDAPGLTRATKGADGKVTVTGTAPPGTVVTVTFPDGTTAQATPDATGDFSVTSPNAQPDGTVRAHVTDAGQNRSDEVQLAVEATPPPAPAITRIQTHPDNSVTVHGTAPPGSSVSITWPDGSVTSGAADTLGQIAVTSPGPQTSGGVQMTVRPPGGGAPVTLTDRVAIDTAPPTVAVSDVPDTVKIGDRVTITYAFNEPVVGFTETTPVVDNAKVDEVVQRGTTYGVKLTVTGGADVVVTIPSGTVKDQSGNAIPTDSVIRITNTTVSDTQKVISDFMAKRANQVMSHQPELIPFLRDAQGGSFTAQITDGRGRFSFVSPPNQIIWSRLEGAWTQETHSQQRYLFGALGAHRLVSETLMIGAMVQVDAHYDRVKGGAFTQGTGWLAGPYVVAKHPDQDLYAEARALYGRSTNRVSPFGTYVDRFETTRALIKLRVSGVYEMTRSKVFPFLDLAYTQDRQHSYVDGAGMTIPAQSVGLGQVQMGLKGMYAVTDAWTVHAGLSATGSRAWSSGKPTAPPPGMRASIELGAMYRSSERSTLEARVRYDGIGAAGYRSLSAQIEFVHRF